MSDIRESTPAASAPAPDAPPRPVTARASRRAWMEPRVRVCWMITLVMFIIALGYTLGQLRSLSRDQWLISNGKQVNAEVKRLGDATDPGKMLTPGERPTAEVKFTLDGKQYLTVRGEVDKTRSTAKVGREIAIRVDPNDPGRWTDRDQVDWTSGLIIDYILVPLVAILAALTFLRRRSVLAIWRDEPADQAVVLETRHSAVYPASQIARVALAAGRDRRVIEVVVPRAAADLRPGDTLYLVFPPERLTAAIVAMLYGP